jgi:drug/metabolite transporter (DMT)-like permease
MVFEGIKKNKNEILGITCSVTGGICWGLSAVTGNYLLEQKHLEAPWLVAVRMLLAGGLLLLISWSKGKKGCFAVWKKKNTAIQQIILAVFGIMLCQMTYFLAIQYSNAGIATVLHYTSPALVMIFFLIIQRKKPSKVEVITLFLVSFGIFLMATHGNIRNMAISRKAFMFGLLSAVFMAVYDIQPRKLLKEFGVINTIGWGMLIGGIILSFLIGIWKVPGIWDRQTVLLMLGIVIYGTILAFGIYLKGVSMIGPVKASMFACVEPLVSMLLSVMILNKMFTGIDVFGMSIIISGVTVLAVFDR